NQLLVKESVVTAQFRVYSALPGLMRILLLNSVSLLALRNRVSGIDFSLRRGLLKKPGFSPQPRSRFSIGHQKPGWVPEASRLVEVC
ncbi:MAG: hypothetical protein ACRCT1_03365, partial [Microcoleaceae cyanobacterium]